MIFENMDYLEDLFENYTIVAEAIQNNQSNELDNETLSSYVEYVEYIMLNNLN
jgi:hypothetical protein